MLAALCILALAVAVSAQGPVFTQDAYSFTVDENAPASFLGYVTATPTGTATSVTYSLCCFHFRAFATLFSIDAQTGALQTTGSLNFERRDSHFFYVQAEDDLGQISSIAIELIIVNVNDKPYFIMVKDAAKMMDDHAAGTVFGYLATDDEDSIQTHNYTLIDDAQGRFALSKINGVSNIVSTQVLSAGTYQVLVLSTDCGSPPYSVQVPVNIVVSASLETVTPPVVDSTNTAQTASSSSFSAGAIAGVVGAAVVIMAVVVIIVLVLRRTRSRTLPMAPEKIAPFDNLNPLYDVNNSNAEVLFLQKTVVDFEEESA